ncbi:hypothetical protein MPH_09025 [Macrophomina phaseolina MS6]|uniref:Uncharacterized protein n=1 Tax=Macrophomina phaseolina (strain MS6) TaxID=1126212 RepID=K2QVP5_MACPH|nr:hypothetical protein MPH_09025 [Macrophomina phaseolina MS6]
MGSTGAGDTGEPKETPCSADFAGRAPAAAASISWGIFVKSHRLDCVIKELDSVLRAYVVYLIYKAASSSSRMLSGSLPCSRDTVPSTHGNTTGGKKAGSRPINRNLSPHLWFSEVQAGLGIIFVPELVVPTFI